MEQGTDLSFIAQQKRMSIGERDFYLDQALLHSTTADCAGPGEELPTGLNLCGEKSREQIKLLQLDRGEIKVAEYLVELSPRELLEAKLHRPYGWRKRAGWRDLVGRDV